MSVVFPPRLTLAQTPTPLMLLERLSEQLGGPRIWVKRDDMTGGVVSGNKIRKLEFSLAAALEQGCDTVITCGGVQSNHCRTTAVLCAQLGLDCHLILRGAEESPDGNLLLDKLVGARISYYPNSEYTARADEILQYWQNHYQEAGNKPFMIPVGASDGIGLWGYIAACEELAADFQTHKITPGHIISATGSGGTQGGLTVGNALFNLGAKVWGINVCDDADYFKKKVLEDMQQWQQWYRQPLEVNQLEVNVIDGYVGAGYARASAAVFATIRRVAQAEGLVLDPVYTGKAFHGMLDQYAQGCFNDSEDIVFVHTGGVFGLFPQRDQIFPDQ
jgi:D-cysteine desulfhydrase